MKHNDFPTGTARHIEGHVDLNDPDTFGFLRVKVTTGRPLRIFIFHYYKLNMKEELLHRSEHGQIGILQRN